MPKKRSGKKKSSAKKKIPAVLKTDNKNITKSEEKEDGLLRNRSPHSKFSTQAETAFTDAGYWRQGIDASLVLDDLSGDDDDAAEIDNTTSAVTILQHKQSHQLLADLPGPKDVWEYMLMCFETPRPSAKEDKIRDKIASVAHAHGLDTKVDSAGNIRIRAPATSGCEQAVKLAFQAHMDMVCSKTSESSHDFEKDPIFPAIIKGKNGDWVKAPGTTLGADNGIGVAGAFAILTDKSIRHGPLEALFTVEEETTMDGAVNVAEYPFLEAQAMINVDSEEEHSVCVGCAGGFEMKIDIQLEQDKSDMKNYECINVRISGLVGGHTGIDIEAGRGNALQVLARCVHGACRPTVFDCATYSAKKSDNGEIRIGIAEITGGNAINAIPRDATACVFVPKNKVSKFTDRMNRLFEEMKIEYSSAERIGRSADGGDEQKGDNSPWKLSVTRNTSNNCSVYTHSSSVQILDLMLMAPHGPTRFNTDVGNAVDTSIAFSLCDIEKTGKSSVFWVHFFCRSYSDYQMRKVKCQLESISRLIGGRASESFNYFNGWEPNITSPLFQQLCLAHEKLFNRQPKVYSVHAGLECGPLLLKYPKMHCVSIGPLITGAHSPDEKLSIPSVTTYYDWLKTTVQLLADVPASKFL